MQITNMEEKPPLRSDSQELKSAVDRIIGFEKLISEYVSRVLTAAEKIGGLVLDASKIIAEAFNFEKEMIVKVKQSQKPDMMGLDEICKSLNEMMAKPSELNEEEQESEYQNHLRAVSNSLIALSWIEYYENDCANLRLAMVHVEKCWNKAEEFKNKVLTSQCVGSSVFIHLLAQVCAAYMNNDINHVEWADALKQLYVRGLMNYVYDYYCPLATAAEPLKLKEDLIELFSALTISLRILQVQKGFANLENVSSRVERLTGRKLLEKHLAQMKSIFPEGLAIQYIRVVNDSGETRTGFFDIGLKFDFIQEPNAEDKYWSAINTFSSKTKALFDLHGEDYEVPQFVLRNEEIKQETPTKPMQCASLLPPNFKPRFSNKQSAATMLEEDDNEPGPSQPSEDSAPRS